MLLIELQRPSLRSFGHWPRWSTLDSSSTSSSASELIRRTTSQHCSSASSTTSHSSSSSDRCSLKVWHIHFTWRWSPRCMAWTLRTLVWWSTFSHWATWSVSPTHGALRATHWKLISHHSWSFLIEVSWIASWLSTVSWTLTERLGLSPLVRVHGHLSIVGSVKSRAIPTITTWSHTVVVGVSVRRHSIVARSMLIHVVWTSISIFVI